jgi:hypothetical protein
MKTLPNQTASESALDKRNSTTQMTLAGMEPPTFSPTYPKRATLAGEAQEKYKAEKPGNNGEKPQNNPVFRFHISTPTCHHSAHRIQKY